VFNKAYVNATSAEYSVCDCCFTCCRAVAVFPVVLGWLERQPDDNTWLLRWDTSSGGSSSRDHPRFAWEVCSVRGSSPNLWSNWELWRKAGLAGMAAGGRLAAAKVRQEAAQHAPSVFNCSAP
jgi:hypothetical protein